MIEVLIASALLSVIILGVASAFNHYAKSATLLRSETDIQEVLNAVRNVIFDRMKAYYRAACNVATLSGELNAPLESGIAVSLLAPSAAAALVDKHSTSPFSARFNTAMTRCQTSPASALPINYFTLNRGIYFCLRLEGISGVTSEYAGVLTQMQPVVGEFFFTLVHAIERRHGTSLAAANPVAQGEIFCGQFGVCLPPPLVPAQLDAPPHPVLGVMHYAFYWAVKASGGNAYKSVGGILTKSATSGP